MPGNEQIYKIEINPVGTVTQSIPNSLWYINLDDYGYNTCSNQYGKANANLFPD